MSKLRLGVLGCGGFGRHHMRDIDKVDDIEIVTLFDPKPEAISLTQAEIVKAKSARVASELQDIAQDEIDAVLISSRHSDHIDGMRYAFDMGWHILCDKPLTTSVANAQEAITRRDQGSAVAMVSYQRHFEHQYRTIKREIMSGKFGKVQAIQATLSQNWKRFTADTWRQDPFLGGGGMLIDSGSHMIDIVMWMTGLRPAVVSAKVDQRQTPVDINATCQIEFEGGAQGSVTVVGDATLWNEDITIWLDQATFFIRGGEMAMVDSSGERTVPTSTEETICPDLAFLQTIRGERPNEAPLECGLDVIRVTQYAYESAKLGGVPVVAH